MATVVDPERNTGRTTQMVLTIPEETGALIIVHNDAMRHYLKNAILDFRGTELFEKCKVVTVRNTHDAERFLRSDQRPIMIDHSFWECAQPSVQDDLRNALHFSRRQELKPDPNPLVLVPVEQNGRIVMTEAEELPNGSLKILSTGEVRRKP